jgi:predicted phosphodiesterase
MPSRHPKLPTPVHHELDPVVLEDVGWWLILGDTHIPFHDRQTIELAFAEARRRRAVGVILNGDVLDSHGLSRFDKSPDDPRYRDEIEMGRQFLAYVRCRLPKAHVVFKSGNHEARLLTYLKRQASALFGLDVLTLPSLLEMQRHGVEHVDDMRVIRLGKLHVVHGHEYRPGIQAPVNPARGLFLRAKSVALCSHFHQTSEHHEPTIAGKPQGAWSIGCACQLNPQYMPLNRWNLGYAMVQLASRGDFSVRNLRVIDGAVV